MRNLIKTALANFKNITQGLNKKRHLNNVAVLTIALSVFIVATFLLFLINTNDMVRFLKKGIRIMAYLESDLGKNQITVVETKIKDIPGVGEVVFISKKEGLAYLKDRLSGQLSLFEDMKENPLPDAFDITLSAKTVDLAKITALAEKIKGFKGVESVEYGQAWLHRFTNIFNLFQFATFGIAGLFFMASVFIIGNTIRLMLFSMREEIEIMRLVGASESFIKKPFYAEGIIMGTFGGGLGLLAVYLGYLVISSNVIQTDTAQMIRIHFFPWEISFVIIACSIFVGWLGCSISLAQFLKKY